MGILRRKGKGDRVLVLFFSKNEHVVGDYVIISRHYVSLWQPSTKDTLLSQLSFKLSTDGGNRMTC